MKPQKKKKYIYIYIYIKYICITFYIYLIAWKLNIHEIKYISINIKSNIYSLIII